MSLPPPPRSPSHGPPPPVPTVVAPGRTGPLRTIGNILWLVLAGVWIAVAHVVAGIVQCITIIGIPFGIASFKLAGLALVPFGNVVVKASAPLAPNARVYLAL
ncbi:MAG: YccF domain-containing protein [Ilumatobacteraceae bacterium]